MLGRTAGGLTWMARYIERAENTARLVEAGQRIALTRRGEAASEWAAVVTAAGAREAFEKRHGPAFDAAHAIDFLLRDPLNPSNALASVEAARINAKAVRTAITREVWEGVNECWLDMSQALKRPVAETELPDLLDRLRRYGSLVRGATIGTMLRDARFRFLRLGTALERADNTARILDVKYHVLLPRAADGEADVGGPLDAAQWEQLMFAMHVRRAYLMVYGSEYRADAVAEFLLLNPRMPRSLVFCADTVREHLEGLAEEFGERHDVTDRAGELAGRLRGHTVEDVFRIGLHEFLSGTIREIAAFSGQIAAAYRFDA